MALMLHAKRTNGLPSSILNSILPASGGDGGDLSHYRTEVVALGLRMLSARGGLSIRVPFI